MSGVTLDFRRFAILNGDQNSAGIGTIMRANGMDDCFHDV